MAIAANGRPPFRADHIGSLLRPRKLRDAFRAHAEGKLDASAFRAAQDEAFREVVKLQEDCGLQVVTDGEFRRISYWQKFVRLTRGLVVKDAVFTFHDAHGHQSDFTAPYVTGKVGRAEPITHEYRFVATFRIPELQRGVPDPWIAARLADYIGLGRAKYYAFTSEKFDAHEAFAMGLVGRVVPHDHFEAAVKEVCEQIQLSGPKTRMTFKDEINRHLTAEAKSVLARVQKIYEKNAKSVDFTDGLSVEFDDWRFNLRGSNTEPLVRLNVESRGNDALMREKTQELLALPDQ